MYEAVCNLNYFKVMKRAIRFISIEPLNLKKESLKIYMNMKTCNSSLFFQQRMMD